MKKILLFTMLFMFTVSTVFATPGANDWNKDGIDYENQYVDECFLDAEYNFYALDRLLGDYREGCRLVYDSASQFTVELGEVAVKNSGGTVVVMTANTSDTTVTWANIDTGSEANSTTYYVYAYTADDDTSTFSVAISTNSTSPSGITYYRRLGSFYNDSSGNITGISNDGAFTDMGSYESKSRDTSYLAATDGIVVYYWYGSSMVTQLKTDSSNPPTTVRCIPGGTEHNFTMPVKQGDYWMLDASGNESLWDGGSSKGLWWIQLD